jgi:hypothetical protein
LNFKLRHIAHLAVEPQRCERVAAEMQVLQHEYDVAGRHILIETSGSIE